MMNVSLTDELRDFVRKKVATGEFPSEEAVLHEAVRSLRQKDLDVERGGDNEQPEPEGVVDYEAIAYCVRKLEGKDAPSLDEVRRMLSKIPGSMAHAAIEEREGRF
jgi:putative addiction module CopG family antidote